MPKQEQHKWQNLFFALCTGAVPSKVGRFASQMPPKAHDSLGGCTSWAIAQLHHVYIYICNMYIHIHTDMYMYIYMYATKTSLKDPELFSLRSSWIAASSPELFADPKPRGSVEVLHLVTSHPGALLTYSLVVCTLNERL